MGFSYYSGEVLGLVGAWSDAVKEISQSPDATIYIRNVTLRFIAEVRVLRGFSRTVTMEPGKLSDAAIDVNIEYFLGKLRCTKILLSCVILRLEKDANLIDVRRRFLENN